MADRDFAAIAEQYARDVVGKKIPACKYVRSRASATSTISEAAPQGLPFRFDPAKAARACKFIELLPHTKGKLGAVEGADPAGAVAGLHPRLRLRLAAKGQRVPPLPQALPRRAAQERQVDHRRRHRPVHAVRRRRVRRRGLFRRDQREAGVGGLPPGEA
jgi:hypothetical protein